MLADEHTQLLREYLWCSLQSNRFVGVDYLPVTLEDPEDHRVNW